MEKNYGNLEVSASKADGLFIHFSLIQVKFACFLFDYTLGGTPWDHPIICDAVIEKHFTKSRAVIERDEDQSNLLFIPQPLATIKRPFAGDWDDTHKEDFWRSFEHLKQDLRFNMFGG